MFYFLQKQRLVVGRSNWVRRHLRAPQTIFSLVDGTFVIGSSSSHVHFSFLWKKMNWLDCAIRLLRCNLWHFIASTKISVKTITASHYMKTNFQRQVKNVSTVSTALHRLQTLETVGWRGKGCVSSPKRSWVNGWFDDLLHNMSGSCSSLWRLFTPRSARFPCFGKSSVLFASIHNRHKEFMKRMNYLY